MRALAGVMVGLVQALGGNVLPGGLGLGGMEGRTRSIEEVSADRISAGSTGSSSRPIKLEAINQPTSQPTGQPTTQDLCDDVSG